MEAYTNTTVFRAKSSSCDQSLDSITVSNTMEIQTDNRLHVCCLCDNSFKSNYDLKTHIKTHAVSGVKPYPCNKCEKVFKKPHELVKHMKYHTGEFQYKCSHCADTFKDEYILTRHMTKHTGGKPYQCNQCDSGFNQARHLKVHLKTHIENHSYICSLCDKSFLLESKLVEHMDVTHSIIGDLPLKCSYCDKTFKRENGLMKHMHIHTLENPYQCRFCDKGFYIKGKYLKHMELHSGEIDDTIMLCDKVLSEEQSHLETDAEQDTFQCSNGEAQPRGQDTFQYSNGEDTETGINSENFIKNLCRSPRLDITPETVKKKKNVQPVDFNIVTMKADNCKTFSQAYELACINEKADSTSFQRIMKQYSIANNLPVVIHPTPDPEIIEFYSKGKKKINK